MSNGPELEERVAALEARMTQVAADAAAARHLAAANDRDLSGLSVKVDAHRAAINALGVQTAARFDRMDDRFDRMDERFDRMDDRFDRMDERFARVDDRFDRMDKRIDVLESEMRAGFAVADENFALIDDNFRKVDERFQQVDDNFRKVDTGFTEIRGKLDQTTAGLAHIVTLLTDDEPPEPAGG